MTDYSKTFNHLKKSESIINQKKFNIDATENKILKQKSFLMDKIKKENRTKDSSGKTNHFMKKISASVSKNIQLKKRTSSHYNNNGSYNHANNTINNTNPKKLSNSKSFNYEKNKNSIKANKTISSINNRIIKRINDNSRNHKNFLDNYEKIKLRKKMMFKNRNNSHNNMNKMNNTSYNVNNNISQINEQKFANSYFNTIFSHEDNKKKENDDNYFSLSQNMGNKKIDVLRKINTNLSINNDQYKKNILNDEANHEYNRSHSNFYSKNTNNSLYTNYLFNNEHLNLNNNLITEINNNEEKMNRHMSNYDNIQSNQPIKLYNENNNNTTINLAGSYNFHQYFNTIINNKNNSNHRNDKNDRNNIINRNYYRNKTENFSQIYNKVQYCQTQIPNNTEIENKNDNINDIFSNNKIIEEINDIKDDLEKKLKQNPTNSKSKKYNTLKQSFEKLIKLFNEYFHHNDLNSILFLLQKLLIGYHEVVSAFSSENRKFKELNYKLTEQYEKIDKNYIECNKIIKEKQSKIEILEKKLNYLTNKNMDNKKDIKKKFEDLNLNLNNSFFNSFFDKNKYREYTDIKNKDKIDKGKGEQYDKVKKLNESNLDDLDALYFFDKIDMKPQRAFSCGKIIPFLPINILKK